MSLFKHLLLLILFTSCAMFEHRDYSDIMEYQDFNEPMFRAGDDFPVITGDTGIDYRTEAEIVSRAPATRQQRYATEYSETLEEELAYLESNLPEREYDFYELYKNNLGGTSEKIYFLTLTPREQREFLRVNKMDQKGTVSYRSRSIASYGDYGANSAQPQAGLALGMNMQQIQSSWGPPAQKEVAGDPSEMNQRWIYESMGKKQYLYFEKGQIAGWETSQN